MRYFKYSVKWYDGVEEDDREESGMVCANTFSEAAGAVAEDYDELCVESMEIVNLGIECRCINKEEIDLAFKEFGND